MEAGALYQMPPLPAARATSYACLLTHTWKQILLTICENRKNTISLYNLKL
jgi:hypothetical protein